MTEKTEALRLADALTEAAGDYWQFHKSIGYGAAAELRRLHEAHDWQYRMAGERLRRVEKLEAQRDTLLEALKEVVAFTGAHGGPYAKARAAIKAVEEQK